MASRVPGLRIKSKKTSNVAAATKMGTMDSSMSRMLQYFLQLGGFFVHLRKGQFSINLTCLSVCSLVPRISLYTARVSRAVCLQLRGAVAARPRWYIVFRRGTSYSPWLRWSAKEVVSSGLNRSAAPFATSVTDGTGLVMTGMPQAMASRAAGRNLHKGWVSKELSPFDKGSLCRPSDKTGKTTASSAPKALHSIGSRSAWSRQLPWRSPAVFPRSSNLLAFGKGIDQLWDVLAGLSPPACQNTAACQPAVKAAS